MPVKDYKDMTIAIQTVTNGTEVVDVYDDLMKGMRAVMRHSVFQEADSMSAQVVCTLKRRQVVDTYKKQFGKALQAKEVELYKFVEKLGVAEPTSFLEGVLLENTDVPVFTRLGLQDKTGVCAFQIAGYSKN